ncbi:uncharacterized protein LOC112599047 [Melanaphis sacchari]|uniref:uncharacterized protein LOC112599047 n=1 Tax=Melanaphis sacchari TaxID=742174 RepID=UPI000DC15383|nr:uncharacterized protein LOC112599047 [Melanaphis sacchari]
MNTKLPKDTFLSIYGLELEKQNHIFNQMNEFTKTMRVHQKQKIYKCGTRPKTKLHNEQTLKLFQKGSIIKDGTEITSDDLPDSTFENTEELATVESGLGCTQIEILSENMDLLNDFESECTQSNNIVEED